MRHVSQRVETRALEELLAARSRIDMLMKEAEEAKKALKSIIGEEWALERFLLGVLRGTVSEQIALPGMDSAMVERGRKIGSTLRQLIEVVERITGVEAEIEAGEDETASVLAEAKAMDETSITIQRPNGESVTASASQMKKALKELNRRKKAGDAPREPEAG